MQIRSAKALSDWLFQPRTLLQWLLLGTLALSLLQTKSYLSRQQPAKNQSVQLHMYVQAKPGKAEELERQYHSAYLPAIRKQKGFQSSVLLRKRDLRDHYEIDIAFESEALRAAWAQSTDHEMAWKKMEEPISQITVQGFDVLQ
jgi:heme-degrading monooxygenase HmoA